MEVRIPKARATGVKKRSSKPRKEAQESTSEEDEAQNIHSNFLRR